MPEHDTSRRGFLNAITGLLLAVLGLLLLLPAICYVLAPLWRKRGTDGGTLDFVDVGPVADIPAGEWRLVPLELVQEDGWRRTRTRRSIWVRRQKDGNKDTFDVLSSICPHLGCPINWHRAPQSQFVCPCHGGLFDESGKQVAGPPPRGMDHLEWEVRSGKLFVRWQEFKIGVDKSITVDV